MLTYVSLLSPLLTKAIRDSGDWCGVITWDLVYGVYGVSFFPLRVLTFSLSMVWSRWTIHFTYWNKNRLAWNLVCSNTLCKEKLAHAHHAWDVFSSLLSCTSCMRCVLISLIMHEMCSHLSYHAHHAWDVFSSLLSCIRCILISLIMHIMHIMYEMCSDLSYHAILKGLQMWDLTTRSCPASHTR